jgi:superfamily II DNA or RNA helicase
MATPSDRFALRPYQEEALRAIHAGFREFDRQIAVLPTGSGKTCVFSQLAADFRPRRTLILAHREELIGQAVDKLHASTGIAADVERAGCRASLDAPVVVASVQTLMRESRRARWPIDHFGLVVVDECHHVVADSYLVTLQRFEQHAKILGVTATADRGDRKSLGEYFQNIACEVSLFDLIRDKWLCEIRVKSVPLGIRLDRIRSTAGDYNAADLGHALEPYLEAIAGTMAEHADRKAIVFLPLISVSERFAALCRQCGLAAEHVDGQSRDRKEILDRFHRNETRLLTNAMLLTEGYDEPSIDCVVCLRPTKIRSLYSQILGRGTRIHPGKDHLLVLDFLFQAGEHKLIKPAHLVAEDEDHARELTAALEEEEDLLEAVEMVKADRTAKLAARLRANRNRPSYVIDPLELAVTLNDDRLADFVPTMNWHDDPPTPKQLQTLRKFGLGTSGVSCKGHASLLLDRLFTRCQLNLATPKQVRALKRLGYGDAEMIRFSEASAILTTHFGKSATPAA